MLEQNQQIQGRSCAVQIFEVGDAYRCEITGMSNGIIGNGSGASPEAAFDEAKADYINNLAGDWKEIFFFKYATRFVAKD